MVYSISTIPVLQDNYVYAITCSDTGDTAIVDCGQCTPVLDYLYNDVGLYNSPVSNHGLGTKSLMTVLLTHHHRDHVDGVAELKKILSEREDAHVCDVVGNANDIARLKDVTTAVLDGDVFEILGGLSVHVLSVDGHTVGDLAYYIPDLAAIFTGDCLFTMGCGRMFEGDYETYFSSMQKIKTLPIDTRIYGGHEYTASNIKFVQSLGDITDEGLVYIEELNTLLRHDVPTVPSFLENELQYNPFLRAKTVMEFRNIRIQKDNF